MQLSLGISPCPNDTFSFYHLLHAAGGDAELEYAVNFADIEELNQALIQGKLDVGKASFGLVPFISDRYQVLDSGAALGFGCGPLLIAKQEFALDDVPKLKIAIPGVHTTANRLLNMAFGEIERSEEYVFSAIEQAVLSGKVDAGLIIHESRFTYEAKGLKKLIDLGQWWETKFAVPVPLGCIVVKRSLPDAVKIQIQKSIAQSVQRAFDNRELPMDFVRAHAQEMDSEVMKQHIGLYVNQYSLSLGDAGRKALRILLQEGAGESVLSEPLFLSL